MRYQIIKPIENKDNIDWKLLGDIFFNLQKETRQILNKTIQLAWEYNGFEQDYKLKYDVYPKAKDILSYSSVHGYAYNVLKNVFKKSATGNLSQTIKRGADRFKTDKIAVLKGDKSVASYRSNQPIDVVSQNIRIYKNENDDYIAKLSLLSTEYRKELGLKSGQISLLIKAGDKSSKTILDRIINGEYKVAASQLLRIKKGKSKWFLNLGYKFENQKEVGLSEDNVMGVDLGVVNTAVMAFNNSKSRYYIEGGEVDAFRRRIEARRMSIQRQLKYCGEGRKGHGRNTALKPIETIRHKIANFRDSANHRYSRYIVDMAIKHGCGVIQIEDLGGINEKSKFLKTWPYFDLQTKIEYKAEEVGIKVEKVAPKYTSQRCSKCGYISKDNRTEQANFKCCNCGYNENADYNAARNLSIRNIDLIIEEELKEQKLHIAI